MSPPTLVAIVDDDPAIRGSVDSFLRSAGLTSLGFASAEDLLADAAQARWACIVTDLHMPGMTGLDLLAEITRRGWHHPVIVMTAYPTDASRNQALRGGAAAFLTKPIDPDGLLAAIEDAIT